MVALAILSIVLTAVYKTQGQTLLMSGQARFYSLAPQLAQEKLAETERLPFEEIASGSGTFGEDFPAYGWSLEVEELPSDLTDGEAYHLVRLEVTVTYNDSSDYRLRTYRFYVD
jgi:general secretion pathway protein I